MGRFPLGLGLIVGIDLLNFRVCIASIVLIGALEVEVNSADEALGWLEVGNTARVTAATQMNQRSSRSHAVFTVHIGEPSKMCAKICKFYCMSVHSLGKLQFFVTHHEMIQKCKFSLFVQFCVYRAAMEG